MLKKKDCVEIVKNNCMWSRCTLIIKQWVTLLDTKANDYCSSSRLIVSTKRSVDGAFWIQTRPPFESILTNKFRHISQKCKALPASFHSLKPSSPTRLFGSSEHPQHISVISASVKDLQQEKTWCQRMHGKGERRLEHPHETPPGMARS